MPGKDYPAPRRSSMKTQRYLSRIEDRRPDGDACAGRARARRNATPAPAAAVAGGSDTDRLGPDRRQANAANNGLCRRRSSSIHFIAARSDTCSSVPFFDRRTRCDATLPAAAISRRSQARARIFWQRESRFCS
jgi:hypothetical protein